MWPYKQKRSTLDFVMRLEILIQEKRSLKYVAAKRKQISISGGGDIWRGPGTANSKLTASCHQRPGPNSLPAFYFYSFSSTEFNACALRTLLSIGLALDFHRAPRQNVSVQSFLPPATSVIVSRVVICFKRGNIWDVLNFHLPGPKCIDAQLFTFYQQARLLPSLKEQSLWKRGAGDDLRLEGAPPKKDITFLIICFSD